MSPGDFVSSFFGPAHDMDVGQAFWGAVFRVRVTSVTSTPLAAAPGGNLYLYAWNALDADPGSGWDLPAAQTSPRFGTIIPLLSPAVEINNLLQIPPFNAWGRFRSVAGGQNWFEFQAVSPASAPITVPPPPQGQPAPPLFILPPNGAFVIGTTPIPNSGVVYTALSITANPGGVGTTQAVTLGQSSTFSFTGTGTTGGTPAGSVIFSTDVNGNLTGFVIGKNVTVTANGPTTTSGQVYEAYPEAVTVNADTNNLAPATWDPVLPLNVTGAVNLTGLVPPATVAAGTVLTTTLFNTGTQNLILTNQDASSSTANQFVFPGTGKYVLPPGGTLRLWYYPVGNGGGGGWYPAAPTSASALQAIPITTTAPTADQYLQYKSGTGLWTPVTASGVSGVTGNGTAGLIPVWDTATDITDGPMVYQTGTGTPTTNTVIVSTGAGTQVDLVVGYGTSGPTSGGILLSPSYPGGVLGILGQSADLTVETTSGKTLNLQASGKKLSAFGAAGVVQQSGDVAAALVAYGFMASADYSGITGVLKANTGTPSVAPDASAGTGASASVSGDDNEGQVTLTTGTIGLSTGSVLTLTYGTAFSATRYVTFSAASSNASLVLPTVYSANEGPTSFDLAVRVNLSISTTYVFNYKVIGG